MTFKKYDEEIIKLLIDHGAHVNIQNNHGTAPIHLATTPAIIDLLLYNKADIDTQNLKGNTALFLNIKKNNKEMVDHLIQKNADIKKCNKNGETTFMIATIYGNQDIYEMINQHPDTNINYQDHQGETVLHKASKNGLIEKATLLIHKSPSLTTISDKHGNSPLMTAIKYNQKEFVKFFIAKDNSPLNMSNNDDENMLDLAAQLQDSTLLTLLLPYFSPDIITRKNKYGLTFVHHAAKGSIINIQTAHQYNLSYAQRTYQGNTCVHIAAHSNNVAMLRFLKENNEDFDTCNYNQETPLVQAALADSLEALQFIVSEKHYINRDVEKIIELLKQHGKKDSKVYLDLKKHHDSRMSKCKKIANEYQEINTIIAKNQSLELSITHKQPVYSRMLSQHTTATPHYKSAEQLYILPEKEWDPLLNHYRECKDHELNRQKALNKMLNDIYIQEEREKAEAARRAQEKVEESHRAALLEQQKLEQEEAKIMRYAQEEATRLVQKEAARSAALLKQQKLEFEKAEKARNRAQKDAARHTTQQKPDNPPQPIPDHDRNVWAQNNIDLFKENFKKEQGKKGNNNLVQKDIHELEKCIKESTLSNANISAENGEKHIENGIILFLNKKLDEIKNELQGSNEYDTTDLQVAIEKACKEITNAIKKLKQPTYEKLAELLGENNNKENNIMKRVIKNING